MANLFLDDLREPPDGWDWAKTAEEAMTLLDTGNYDTVSLDNDLGEALEGYDVAKYIAVNNLWPQIIAIHSANPVGRQNMKRLIEGSGLYDYPQTGTIGQWTGATIYFKRENGENNN